MNYGYLLLGTALLVLTVVDLFWTTLWVDGGSGPVSAHVSSWAWRVIRRIGRQNGRVLSLGGPLILVLVLVTWIGLLWAGWTLVFAAGEPSLVDARNPEAVTWEGRVYFVAYTLSTMGNGDFVPVDGGWQFVASLTTLSGILFITLGVTYVLSVLSAVVDKRSFAGSVAGLGDHSESFVRNGWEQDRFAGLDLPIDSLAGDLDRLAEQHQAYPILHYYHSRDAMTSSAVAVAVLDEAMLLLRHGVAEEHRPNDALLERAESSTGRYLRTLTGAFVRPAEETPPPPDLDPLREAGVPVVDDEELERALAEHDDRRRALLGMVDADARAWPPIEEPSDGGGPESDRPGTESSDVGPPPEDR